MRKAPKRCFYFDSDGRPWSNYGCPRTSEQCGFVHPDDPEWDNLPPIPPPRWYKDRARRSPPPDSPRTPDYKTRSMGRNESPSRHRTSPQYRSDRRSPSPRHSEDSRRTHDDDHERRRRSYDYSHGSRDEKRRVDSTLTTTPSQSYVSSEHPTSLSLVPPSMPSAMPSLPLPPPTTSTPPPPRTEPPLPPPPPLPTAPSFLSNKRVSSPPQPTVEELRVIWGDRIKLLAECVQTRNQYMKIKEDIADCRRLVETFRMPSLPDEDKQSLSAELSKLESRREETKQTLEEKVSRLTNSNSWPIGPRTEIEEGEVEKYQEMVKYIEELKNTVTEMNRVLNDIRERKSTAEVEHTPMDVDPLAGSARPLKRRRVSDAGQPSPPIATDEEDVLRDKLLSLEDRFSSFENDLTEHNQELMQEVNAYIETRFEEIASTVKDTSAGDSSNLYDKADLEVKRMGGEVVELAEEMGALLLRANAQETETATLQHELEESKKDYISLERRLQDYINEREKDRRAIEALQAALAAHVAHPPSPPRSPRTPTQDYVLNLIEEPLLEVVHTSVKPLIDDLRNDVEHMLRNQNTEIYETLWGKLSLTLRLVETISGRIEKGDEMGQST